MTMEQLLDYLADEAPGGDTLKPGDLHFLRTAQVGNRRYWIWRFTEPDGGDPAYLTVSADQKSRTTSYETDYYGLTPEQFILGAHHGLW